MKLAFLALSLLLFFQPDAFAQSDDQNTGPLGTIMPESVQLCGSHELLKHQDHHHPGLLESCNSVLRELTSRGNSARTNEILVIPVVFHVVYNNAAENLSDEVILDQLQIMNECFRRTNADAIDTRPEFLDLVGDSRIEFRLADFDPEGNATTGIIRTNTSIEYFGGVLPYGPGQNAEIAQWVEDELFDNYFRIANTDQGGSDAWDTNRYLNVWIGDLRIFEPQFNNFEEIAFFAFATPPPFHPNWAADDTPWPDSFPQGILTHYVNVGSNNPNSFPAPYTAFNGLVNTGKLLVHETGHYFGLRHIWGDGNCSVDDFIDDTPNASDNSQWTCNLNSNTCTDNIGGVDLPDMLENYMDYSSANCQNAFTNGQIDLMRSTILEYRPDLPEIVVNTTELSKPLEVMVYPNPGQGTFNLELPEVGSEIRVQLFNSIGALEFEQSYYQTRMIRQETQLASGVYLLRVSNPDGGIYTGRLVIE